MNQPLSLEVGSLGPIQQARIEFGDLTVLVGPQASGKSIFLQLLKLALDTGFIHDQLQKHGMDWERSVTDFLDVYLGDGMGAVWVDGKSEVILNSEKVEVQGWATPRRRSAKATLFYIPAQRVLTLANGWPRPFQGYASEDPFVLRDFSESFRLLLEHELGQRGALFPQKKRLKSEYRQLLIRHIFGQFGLEIERHGAQKRMVLRAKAGGKPLPFTTWSAGQREFVPLLMGLYYLMPPSKVSRREPFQWVVVEEPEMGLHPAAIVVVLLLMLELLRRGYRVCVSTHSPQVLDLVWGIRSIQRQQPGQSESLLDVFGVRKTPPMKNVVEVAVQKTFRVYYFDREGKTHDISDLDPASGHWPEAFWGGLTEFTARVNDLVAGLPPEQSPGTSECAGQDIAVEAR